MRISTLTFSLLFILNFCFAQNTPIDVFEFKKVYQLEELTKTIDLPTDILLVQGVTSDEKYLYILNTKELPIVKAYRLSDGKYMGGFGNEGKGPGEYDTFMRSGFNARKNQIITQDRKYVRIYDVMESADKLEFKRVKEIRMPTDLDIVNQGILLKDDLYAGSIMFTPKDFVTFPLSELDSEVSNEAIGDFGDYPQEYPDIPATAYHHLYQGGSSYAYDGDALVRYYTMVPMLRLFSLPDGSYRDIHLKPKNDQIKNLKPDSRGKSIENGIEMLLYFARVSLGRDYIVAEYQESKFRKVATTSMGNLERVPLTDRFLLVFNREGELLAKLSTPEWLERFHVTPNNQLIFFHPEISDQLFTVDLNQFK